MSFGITIEKQLSALLAPKLALTTDPEFDHVYKLDFVVNRFKAIAKLLHIGVQLTTNPFDNGKKARFVYGRKNKLLVDRSLYVEVSPETDIEAYGIELLYVALVHFAFSKDMAEKDIMGVTIGPDVTYRFFDIEKDVEIARMEPHLPFANETPDATPLLNAEHLKPAGTQQHPAPPQPAPQKRFRGKIRKYIADRGFGFIRGTRHEGSIDEWFFHIENCDGQLRDEIDARLTTGNFNGIQVTFADGPPKKDAPAASALDVRLHAVDKKHAMA